MSIYVIYTEMPTLNVALQEYERHFSGIWGHFQECRIFRLKSTKCTHYIEVQYCSYSTLFLPLKCMAESFTSTSCIIFYGLQLASVRAKDLYNLMNFGIHTFFTKESILFCITGRFSDSKLFTHKTKFFPIH